jgi:hypothetical protein
LPPGPAHTRRRRANGTRVIARFDGPNGEIAVAENLATGARHYEEGGVSQSCVLPGGETGVAYIRIMAALLAGGAGTLLLGCGGGALATMLHRRGASVTVVDVNPISFQVARALFWMPGGIACITADMRAFIAAQRRRFDAIGIDVGGPRFSYRDVLGIDTVARVRRALRGGGRIGVNISCETPGDPIPGCIARRFRKQGLEVWVFMESASGCKERNAVILASARAENACALAAVAEENWSLARLA